MRTSTSKLCVWGKRQAMRGAASPGSQGRRRDSRRGLSARCVWSRVRTMLARTRLLPCFPTQQRGGVTSRTTTAGALTLQLPRASRVRRFCCWRCAPRSMSRLALREQRGRHSTSNTKCYPMCMPGTPAADHVRPLRPGLASERPLAQVKAAPQTLNHGSSCCPPRQFL